MPEIKPNEQYSDVEHMEKDNFLSLMSYLEFDLEY